ncbi:hypothetical protein [Virgisporangium aurantiacum]|uniref:NlpC/P60 family protein n=1 Tax=Virgisporangium aurantiacum TaxID=175570 RepID=A0A8J4E160_9ACTN|nr:hypothetical protein [Virgisporangium aurantiacum]GIJ55692.1 hypothetical protein Vau01_032080 [Virgisporangium aurantiacum]
MRRNLTRAGLALALALAGAVTGVEVGSPARAVTPAEVAVTPTRGGVASAIDGPITRAEIVDRAESWVDVPYSPTDLFPDVGNSRVYRRDCAGLVAMAWHLGSDPWTGTLPTVSTPIRRPDLAPGDILLDASAHVILFDRWEPDRVHFSYYSLGPTTARHVTHASIDKETLDGRPNSAYQARRYTRVVTG